MNTDSSFSISLCIATHERASLLRPTLEAIAVQLRLPDEIIISDSSLTDDTKELIEAFAQRDPRLHLIHARTECKALPWHRWNGFQHSTGDIVLFLDDDIMMAPHGLGMLEQAYIDLARKHEPNDIAGVGFYWRFDDGTEKLRRPQSFEERWLGITNAASASITPGGIGVPPKGMPRNSLVEVERLSGGCMSYRRQVLEQVGLLNRLVELFNQQVGPSEDTVFSCYAAAYGRLFMLTYPLAFHPNVDRAVHTVDARNGWRKGLIETWGRAHTMRWIASDWAAYRKDWLRVASLELFRSLWWGPLRKPFSADSWARTGGALFGICLSLFRWRRIPSSARTFEG